MGQINPQLLALGCSTRRARRDTYIRYPTVQLVHIPTRHPLPPKEKRRAPEMWGEDGKTRALLS